MVDTSTTPSIGIMKVVPDRSAATLLPFIHDNIRPGNIIHSDKWAAYTRLRSDPRYDFRSVNHSLHFVDPVTGVHNQTIESYWAKVKKLISILYYHLILVSILLIVYIMYIIYIFHIIYSII